MKTAFVKNLLMIFVLSNFIFSVNFLHGQGGDNCIVASSLTVNATCVTTNESGIDGNTSGVTPSCTGGSDNDEGWYSFTAVGTSTTVEFLNSNRNFVIAVYSDCPAITEIGCDATGGGGADKSLTVTTVTGNPYYYQVRRYGGGGSSMSGDICVWGAPAPVPVELVGFYGENKIFGNVLNWETYSELNCDYFAIERSEDGMSFSEIGIVDGAGNSSENIQYEFVDDQFSENVTFYRLRQVDYDGQSEVFGVISVEKDLLKAKMVKFYPNPTSNNIVVNIGTPNETMQLHVIDVFGKEIWNRSLITDSKGEIPLNISEIKSGIYFIKVSCSKMKETIKFVKY